MSVSASSGTFTSTDRSIFPGPSRFATCSSSRALPVRFVEAGRGKSPRYGRSPSEKPLPGYFASPTTGCAGPLRRRCADAFSLADRTACPPQWALRWGWSGSAGERRGWTPLPGHTWAWSVPPTRAAIVTARRDGKRVWRGKCASDPQLRATLVRKHASAPKRVMFETGPLSVWFFHALSAEGLPAICIARSYVLVAA